MKTIKFSLVLIGILLSLSVMSQDILMLRATEATVRNPNLEEDFPKPATINTLITVNLADDVIRVDNKFKDTYYIRESSKPIHSADDTGKSTTFLLTAYDKDNVSCRIVYTASDDHNIIMIAIIYSNLELIYKCKKI